MVIRMVFEINRTAINDKRAFQAYFKVYRQFKMYNDPAFNPALVAERGA